MLRKLLPFLVIGVWGITVVSLSEEASATIPLTRAEIQKIRNLVELKPKNRQQHPARPLDAMFPGDGVSTGRASLAELRFNDRSLARVGEQAVFQFLPRTRNLKLSNGTVLLLIPPKQGLTRVQTPNAAAAIRGSALFIRYDAQTDTTTVGALTNSGIEVSNKDASQSRVLEAGQMLVIIKNRIQGLYNFDLRNFYETSDLVRGLDLNRKTGMPSSDPAIAQVQEETVTAVAAQKPITGAGVIENPSFIKLTGSSPTSPSAADNSIINNNFPVDPLVDIGQILSNNDKKKDNSSGSTSVTTPSVTTPSVTTPPKIESPTNPSVTIPSVTIPSVTTPPVTTPPKIESPTDPPVTTPPKIESPTDPPVTTPPKIESPTDPPVTTPPKIESPTDPPVTTPPKIESPTNPPPTTPPKIESPTNPPPTTPPKIESPTNPTPTTPPKIESPTNPTPTNPTPTNPTPTIPTPTIPTPTNPTPTIPTPTIPTPTNPTPTIPTPTIPTPTIPTPTNPTPTIPTPTIPTPTIPTPTIPTPTNPTPTNPTPTNPTPTIPTPTTPTPTNPTPTNPTPTNPTPTNPTPVKPST